MAGEFWLSEAQWEVIGPLLPKNQPGARRTDDRRVISGIVHILKTGCRWQDCPAVYRPSTTVYNRFRRWTMRGGFGVACLTRLRAPEPGGGQAIDSTTAKAHRSAAGGKGGRRRRRLAVRAAAAARKSTPSSTRADAPSPSK
jgi:transposase